MTWKARDGFSIEMSSQADKMEAQRAFCRWHLGAFCRAARGWLGFTQKQLADEACVSTATIRRIESTPSGKRTVDFSSAARLIATLEEYGVRIQPADPRRGLAGALFFLDDKGDAGEIDGYERRKKRFNQEFSRSRVKPGLWDPSAG